MGKKYIDSRDWKYKVMGGLGENNFKARYQRPEKKGSISWHCVRTMPWRDTPEAAQADLDRLAAKNGWNDWEEEQEEQNDT